MFTEFIGITQDVSQLIESRRSDVVETKNEIIKRVFLDSTFHDGQKQSSSLRLGQGVQVKVGERLYLFLSKAARLAGRPDGEANVGEDGIYLAGKRVSESRGSAIQPAMAHFLQTGGHVNHRGKLKSFSAFRQWHVVRDGKFVPLDELKDPSVARRRGRTLSDRLLAEFDSL